MENVVDLGDEEFLEIRDLINEYSGIYFDDGKQYLLQNRLSDRVGAHNFKTFDEYYYFLKYDRNRQDEFNIIMDILTTNETYFYRETAQLEAFVEEVLPALKTEKESDSKDKKIKILCAGCSTGEEAYTLAILAQESGVAQDGWKLEILATDISNRVLGVARKGLYKKSSFRNMDEWNIDINGYLESSGEEMKVKDEIRTIVSFGQMNLLNGSQVEQLKDIDIIFCRNVIIYFNDESKKKVIDSFHKVLNGGGYLFLGHSESLFKITESFLLKQIKKAIIYVKP